MFWKKRNCHETTAQGNKTPKPNQSLRPKSSSWTGTVFLCKCNNGKKAPAELAVASKRLSSGSWRQRLPNPHGLADIPAPLLRHSCFCEQGGQPWEEQPKAHVFQQTCTHRPANVWVEKIFILGWALDLQKHPKMKLGSLVLLQCLSNSQHSYSEAKEQILLHQMKAASVQQAPGLSKISLIGASNYFFHRMKIENNHNKTAIALKWSVGNES